MPKRVRELQRYFEQVASGGDVPFRREEFRLLTPPKKGTNLPDGEILLSHPDCESLFGDVHAQGIAADVDLFLFPQAVRFAGKFDKGVSINVQTDTVFDDRFLSVLKGFAKQLTFDPSKIWIEVTEQGGIPSGADFKKLEEICRMGFRLAVDDVDPADSRNMERVVAINGAASMHKFPHQTMQAIRDGGRSAEVALKGIADLRAAYSGSVIVMEGVRPKDKPLFPLLGEAGVNLLQYRQS